MKPVVIFGYDSSTTSYKPLVCNADGKLIIDPSEILEDTPTQGEVGKAPTSNWAATRFEDTPTQGVTTKAPTSNWAATRFEDTPTQGVTTKAPTSNWAATRFEDTPTDGVTNKAPTSNWAYDHNANQNAHHTKFTITEHDVTDRHPLSVLSSSVCSETEADSKISTHAAVSDAHHSRFTESEAREACKLDGTRYWSAPGSAFTTRYPHTDNVDKLAYSHLTSGTDGLVCILPVHLPDGAVITSVIVHGDESASGCTWTMYRVANGDLSFDTLASEQVNTADTTISYATIQNQYQSYHISIPDVDSGYIIYDAVIAYKIEPLI